MLSVNQIIFFKFDFTAFVAYKIFQQVCLKVKLSGRASELNQSDIVYLCGGFNTPTLCVVTKGIKAECNHLMRTTYPDACVGGVDSAYS